MRTPSAGEDHFRRAQRGDSTAFRMIVQEHQSFAFRVVMQLVNNRADAEDITQEVFVKVWQNLHKYKREMKFTTWLYRIITNLCLDHLKSAYMKRSRSTTPVDSETGGGLACAADETLLGTELNELILKAAETLTPKQRIVFVLRDVEGLSVDEACAACGLSAGKLKSNLYYARAKVTELVSKYYLIKKS